MLNYRAQGYQYKELEEKLRFEEGCLVFSETESEIEKHSQNIHKIERVLDFLSHRPLTPTALDTVLNKQRITPQAYHSRSSLSQISST